MEYTDKSKIYFKDKETGEVRSEDRQRAECWTRIVGYHRPVDQWHIGKQQELKDREYFKEPK